MSRLVNSYGGNWPDIVAVKNRESYDRIVEEGGFRMDTSREKLIEVFAKDDAKWDNCFADVNTRGVVRNHKLTAYDTPNDPEGKKVYDQHWHKAKEGR